MPPWRRSTRKHKILKNRFFLDLCANTGVDCMNSPDVMVYDWGSAVAEDTRGWELPPSRFALALVVCVSRRDATFRMNNSCPFSGADETGESGWGKLVAEMSFKISAVIVFMPSPLGLFWLCYLCNDSGLGGGGPRRKICNGIVLEGNVHHCRGLEPFKTNIHMYQMHF